MKQADIKGMAEADCDEIVKELQVSDVNLYYENENSILIKDCCVIITAESTHEQFPPLRQSSKALPAKYIRRFPGFFVYVF